MGKEEIFSKLNNKDYNNKLEKIIEKKSFSEDTKNLLLNMFYKIEAAYEDYSKIKSNIISQKEILEEILSIIENDCEKIELIKPKLGEENILKNQKSIGIKEEKKIISYQNDKAILDALYKIQKGSFKIKDEYNIIKNSLEMLLNFGDKMNKTEIIRDFDGWAWNIASDEIEDICINIIYQIIQILVGNQLLKNWLENINDEDYIILLQKKLEEYGQETGEDLYKLICQISILIYTKQDKKEKNKLIIEKENIKKELEKMEDKKTYLQNLANNKKEIGKKIKQIDETINNKILIKQEFNLRNKKLNKEDKIFSLSDLYDVMEKERKQLMIELNLCAGFMDPIKYFKTKAELQDKFDVINELNLEKEDIKKLDELISELQKKFLIAIRQKIKKITIKKEIVDLIYQMRYYKFLFINKSEYILNIKEDIDKTNKLIITKACRLKAINILSNNIEQNFKIISEILNTKIINLEGIIIEINKKQENILLNIYEENIIERSIEYDKIEDLKIKYNKKIKLFI